MKGFHLLHFHEWYPGAAWGYTAPYYAVHLDTIFFTWCALSALALIAYGARRALKHPQSLMGFVAHQSVAAVYHSIRQTMPACRYHQVSFIAALFMFIFLCNTIIFFPFLEEPTKDLNTTLAFGILSFFFVQSQIALTIGFNAYIHEYIKTPLALFPAHEKKQVTYALLPLRFLVNGVASLAILPLELMSKLASIVSLSFRLFGNIFGGSIIMGIWKYALSGSISLQLIGIFSGMNIILLLFFGLFEGLIQAFVFAMLTVTYLSLGVQGHNE